MSAASELRGEALPLRVALLGSPNCGKTTLFNALTGSRAKVGNYPGVTVERRIGSVARQARPIELLDLPGSYSLRPETPDEQVVDDVLAGRIVGEPVPDALLIVVDATTLRRGLGLVLEILEHWRGRPCALVVTMIDELVARGGLIDFAALGRELGLPVLPVVGHRGVGLDALERALGSIESWPQPAPGPGASEPEARFERAEAVLRRAERTRPRRDARTDRIDAVLLHPFWGLAAFALVMILLFQSIFAWAVPAMDALDAAMLQLAAGVRAILPAGLLTSLLTDGVLAGVGAVVVFLPQIVILFTLIHFLEDTGYMARAAFVVDRVMGWFGLQGRSFVVLLSCYACAVPGIMAARTIPNPRDRLTTILVAPFMTCSARLPVYTLLIAAFIPAHQVLGLLGLQGLVMFGLYALGAATAIVSALLLKSTIVRGRSSTFFMELPPYRLPTLRLLASQVWRSATAFLKRAGTIIFVASLLIWVLLSFPTAPEQAGLDPAEQARANLEASAGAQMGKALEPLIEPLGYDWRIGVGLVASLAAREILVSTLAQVYAVADPDDFRGLRQALRDDVDPETGEPSFTLPVALSLLVFFVFALQCTSTIAVMARETGSWRWPALAFSYMLGLAYAASFLTYRAATALL